MIAQKIDQKKASTQIIGITNLMKEIQFHALMFFGFLIRGGVTIGELSIDSTVVWGTGLIDAHNIESNLANYPRIIFSNKLLKKYDSCEQKTLNLYALLEQDFDGLWFVDYIIGSYNITTIPIISKTLQEISGFYTDKPYEVRRKVNWLIDYFNATCSKLKERGDYEKYVLPYI